MRLIEIAEVEGDGRRCAPRDEKVEDVNRIMDLVLEDSGIISVEELDSGTGDLTGISGTMNIIIEEEKHSYEFEYSLPQ